MANEFIRLGDRLINLANVEKVQRLGAEGSQMDALQITYVSGGTDTFSGAERDALLRWIRQAAPNLLAQSEGSA